MNEENKKLIISRIFDAPRERVWQAWTDPEMFKKWWGPKKYTAPDSKMDVQVGGKYLASMQGPDGKKIWSGGTYKEIIPMEKLVLTDSFADENGNVVPSSHYGMPGMPLETQIVVTFEDEGGNTKMTVRHEGMAAQYQSDASGGWNESFDKLAKTLKQFS